MKRFPTTITVDIDRLLRCRNAMLGELAWSDFLRRIATTITTNSELSGFQGGLTFSHS